MSGSEESHERPYFEQHGGFYRSVSDVSTPWRASPVLDKPKPAPYFYVKFSVPDLPLPSTALWSATAISHEPAINKKQKRKLLQFLRSLVSPKPAKPATLSYTPPPIPQSPEIAPVPLREWKAWGYYACPVVDGVTVRNYPPDPDAPSIDFEAVFLSIRDDDGTAHPERWIAGLEHPSLPPRPSIWLSPVKGQPNLFPWELQLNPFLQHRPFGSAPLCWNLNQQEQLYGEPNAFWLDEQDLAQPATYPFVTHMYINGIADFPGERFPWPCMITNWNGITCRDVFNALYETLNQHISEDEYSQWTRKIYQRDAAQAAYQIRSLRDGQDGMKRVDLLGFNNFFRGLEPHPNREGWMLFTGLA